MFDSFPTNYTQQNRENFFTAWLVDLKPIKTVTEIHLNVHLSV